MGVVEPVRVARVDHYHSLVALREGVIIRDNELRQEKMYLFIVYHVPCLLQNETEQNVLFVDAFTLNCFLTDFHGG